MYELIQHQRLNANASSITFSNIPQIYTDLYLVTSLRAAGGVEYDESRLFFNGVNSNLSAIDFDADGYSIYTFSVSNGFAGVVNGSNSTANAFSNQQIYISNYSSSNLKSYSVESVAEGRLFGVGYLDLASGLWNQTSPITSITLTSGGGSNWIQNSSATLYGVNRTAGRGRPKAIGGNITYANGYWVHTFTGSGTFFANEALNVDTLVVAGGGGSGFHIPGGGGAGGLLAVQASVQRGAYPILVGSGGPAGATEGSPQGTQGGSSSAFSFTAIGGGYGGTRQLNPASGGAGGSGGGGGGGGNGNPVTGGAGTSGQGNAGGNGYNYPDGRAAGGGGGGAAAAGVAGSFGVGGNGGAGALWNGSYYAGGGGGSSGNSSGTGGIGGGGNGTNFGSNTLAGNGTANTGGGAGGGEYGASGGSGVVIIRYRAD